MVDNHGFIVALVGEFHLLNEAFILVDRVIELGVGVGKFLAVDHELEAFGQFGIVAVTFCQGRHLDGVVDDECGLNVGAFALFAEDFVDELAFTHGFINLDAERSGGLAELFLGHAGDVDAGVFFDGVGHGHAAIGSLEVDDIVAHLHFGSAVDIEADAFDELLGELHHPVIVFVGHIDFHAGKLGVVGAIHAFVAEVFADFIDTLETAHDESLEIELGGDAHVEVDVERIVVGDKRTCAGTTCNRLKDGGFHLHVVMLVEEVAHRSEHL